MKKQLSTVLIALLICGNVFSQKVYTTADIFTQKEIVWMGIDFTKCKMIGEPSIHGAGLKPPIVVTKYYFQDWNQFPVREGDKFDVAAAFDKSFVAFDIESVNAKNQLANPDSLVITNVNYKLNTAEFPEMIRNHTATAKEGIAAMFFAELINGDSEFATFYVVMFDIASKKILLQEKMEGHAFGMTVKNYWAGAIKNVLDKIPKEYKEWKKNAK